MSKSFEIISLKMGVNSAISYRDDLLYCARLQWLVLFHVKYGYMDYKEWSCVNILFYDRDRWLDEMTWI